MEIEEQNPIQTQFSNQGQKQIAVEPTKDGAHDGFSASSSSSSSSSVSIDDQVRLAAMSIGFNVRLKAADMPVRMQEHALRVARSVVVDSALPERTRINSSLLARSLKKARHTIFSPPLFFLELPFSGGAGQGRAGLLTLSGRSGELQEFDSAYGPAWHCVAGKSFGSFVTHSPGGFLYFTLEDSLVSVLLFKTEVQLVKQP